MSAELESVPDERAAEAEENKAADEGCPVKMGVAGSKWKCNRPLHNPSSWSDERPVCLMHSKDPNKGKGKLFEVFWREFEVILENAGEGEAHFEGFSFPELDLRGRCFRAVCRFDGAIFTKSTDFSNATFTQDTIFSHATFTHGANFMHASFTRNAEFIYANFAQSTSFAGASFTQPANFIFVTFTQPANFIFVTFTQDADFLGVTFMQHTDFSGAIFTQDADFGLATFMHADFEGTEFCGTATWGAARFLESATFRRTKFDPSLAEVPSAVFALASFSNPGEIIFDDVDLSRALFHNCDVSEVWFTSSVRWARRGSRGEAVFEESVSLQHATGLLRDGGRDYRAIAQLYQQLKKNYDARLDYWTANEFHFGEMEMKRMATPHGRRLLGLRRWWRRWLSLTALYRWGSDYGNSFRKPLVWLLAMLVLFAVLFPLPHLGLRRSGFAENETYGSVWRLGSSAMQHLKGETKLIGKSMLVAVDMATFQRNPEYAPAYPVGRALAIVETLVTSTLFGLFLLAIRRQFRR
jgi:uncharacterized protein YjbI with pentapeptide repeats